MARDCRKIKAWQLTDELALMVYKATKDFPKSEIWEIGYLNVHRYEELWAKGQEGLRTLQGLISYAEKSEV
jgi:hypothetical protein